MSSLTIVIPALNEEKSIASIIQRCIDARSQIIKDNGLSDVIIVVVNDGSTDRTSDIAATFSDHIHLISYRDNRGYGAAIKMGWNHTSSEYMGFLDADGTCDPTFFNDLLILMQSHKTDIVLGSRLHANSSMPTVRKIGNTMYAKLLNIWTGDQIKDCASGMRVVKRNVLSKIYPLPNGLHFTPAMSAKALFSNDITIAEIPMPYSEREGESKLNVFKDGIRFLKVILEIAVQYNPRRLFNLLGLLFIIIAVIFSFKPLHYFLSENIDHDVFIYRYIGIYSFSISGFFLIGVGFISQNFIDLLYYNKYVKISRLPFFNFIFLKHGIASSILIFLLSIVFLLPPILEYFQGGDIPSFNWFRLLFGFFIFNLAVMLFGFGIIGVVLSMIVSNKDYHNIPSQNPLTM